MVEIRVEQFKNFHEEAEDAIGASMSGVGGITVIYQDDSDIILISGSESSYNITDGYIPYYNSTSGTLIDSILHITGDGQSIQSNGAIGIGDLASDPIGSIAELLIAKTYDCAQSPWASPLQINDVISGTLSEEGGYTAISMYTTTDEAIDVNSYPFWYSGLWSFFAPSCATEYVEGISAGINNHQAVVMKEANIFYGELYTIDPGGEVTTGAVYKARFSHAGTIGDGFLYKGYYEDAYYGPGTFTNKWGLHISGEDKNYLSGNLEIVGSISGTLIGIGTSPLYSLHIAKTFGDEGADDIWLLDTLTGTLTTDRVYTGIGVAPTIEWVEDASNLYADGIYTNIAPFGNSYLVRGGAFGAVNHQAVTMDTGIGAAGYVYNLDSGGTLSLGKSLYAYLENNGTASTAYLMQGEYIGGGSSITSDFKGSSIEVSSNAGTIDSAILFNGTTTATPGAIGSLRGAYFYLYSSAADSNIHGMDIELQPGAGRSSEATSVSEEIGFWSFLSTADGPNSIIYELTGAKMQLAVYGNAGGAPTTTLAHGYYAILDTFANSVVDTYYSFYGKINAQGTVTNKWGIYSEGADKNQLSGNLLIEGSSRYLNFNTTLGSTGYGFRDNSGVMEYKNSGGAWSSIVSSNQLTTTSGDIIDQIPSLAGYATEAYVTVVSGDIIAQIPSDYISDAEMTVISGDLVAQIPTDFYTTGEVDTISGDITTYVDDEVADIRASRGGTTFYFVDLDSADVAGYEILGTAPGGNAEDTDEVSITSTSGSVLLGKYVTISGSPNTTLIPGGEWTFTIWAKASTTAGTTTIATKVYKRNLAGTETELFTSTTADINASIPTAYITTTTQTGVELLATDRIVMKHYAQTSSVAAVTITYYYEGIEHYSRVATPVVVSSISDHGQLSGLADDDHTQYLNTTRGDARYYTETEVNTISGDINTNLSNHISDRTDAHGITVTTGKLLTVNNTLTLTATDGSTLAIGAGGTLGTAAYTASTAYAPAASGILNGNSHDHLGGDGAQIAYSSLGSIPSTFTPSSHNNTAHSETYITSAGVTYENLNANSDVGTGSTQVAQGDHTHDSRYYTESETDVISGALNTKLDTHKSSSDHDSRYYTESEVNTISGALNTKLDTHKSSSDHDSRYYTESEVDTISGAINTNLNTHISNRTNVHGLTVSAGKTLTVSNTLTLTATDSSTLAIGTGGTLGTAAYTASTAYATSAQGVTNGNSHDHSGGDGAQIDHGGLGGLSDDDHSQYLNTARGDARYYTESETDVISGALNTKLDTHKSSADHDSRYYIESEVDTISGAINTNLNTHISDRTDIHGLTVATGKTLTANNTLTLTATDGSTLAIGTGGTLGTAAYTASTAYAPAASGVLNGNSHDHNGGDGAQIVYSTLGSIPSTFAPSSHNNTAHSETYITSAGVTYENLSANGDIGTTANTVASGAHTHSQLHDRSHTITSTSDHTAGNWKVLYSNGSGQITELTLGAAGTVLYANGATSAPTFTAIIGASTDNKLARYNSTNAIQGATGASSLDDSDNLVIAGSIKTTGTSKVQAAFYAGSTDPTNVDRLNYDGYFYATRVYNAVYNDYADYQDLDDDLVFGKCYYDTKSGAKICNDRCQKSVIGVASNTYGHAVGNINKGVPIAIAGWVLAYVDKEYEIGTPLTNDDNGNLTEITKEEKLNYPERIVAIYKKPEISEYWGPQQVLVDGRHWVKIK